jgi:hypothetical protein
MWQSILRDRLVKNGFNYVLDFDLPLRASIAIVVILVTQNAYFFHFNYISFSIQTLIDYQSHSLLSLNIIFQCILYRES